MIVRFTVPGSIVPWARARSNGKLRFTPKRQADFMAALRALAAEAMAGAPPLSGPVELRLLAVWPWPKSLSARKRAAPGARWKISRPDFDNTGKILADSLNLIVFQDDAQIAAAHVWKMYGERPGLTVELRTLA